MKRKLMIIGFTVLFILANIITCYAATEPTVTLQADKTEIKAGETFTVTLSATCEDGINGIDTTYTYDTEKLELVSANVASSDFASLGTDNQITVICNSTESITSADIYVLTFKVRDGVAADSTATVSISETILDSDAATDSQHIIATQEVTITVASAEENPGEENPGEENPGEENPGEENPGEENPGEENPGEENPGEENPGEEKPGEEKPGTTPGQNQPTTDGTTVVVGGDNKDTTIANTAIPKAGINAIIIIAIMVASIVAVIIYRKNQSYRDIK